jgi:hypothetical protein
MAQISKGDTFADSQQLTATRLNQLVDSAQILVGAITEQSSITANTLEASDSTIVSDAGVLRQATIGDILNSNIPISTNQIITSAVDGFANKDVVVTPNDGLLVTGKVFTSADGITAVVTSIGHELQTGQVVTITASVSAYSGTYAITVLSLDTFSYKIKQDTPVAASGTCSYTKSAAELVKGNLSTTQNSFVGGSSTVVGSQIVNGNASVDGTLKVIGDTTVKGVANFDGTAIKFKSKTLLNLFEVTTISINTIAGFVSMLYNYRIGSGAIGWAVQGGDVSGTPNAYNGAAVNWKESHTIPAGEMWEITWNWNAGRWTDDISWAGYIKRTAGGSWTQIGNYPIDGAIYTSFNLHTVETLTNNTTEPVTYDFAFKSAIVGGSGSDSCRIDCGNGSVRTIRKYKIA